jgi:hypothetical protein
VGCGWGYWNERRDLKQEKSIRNFLAVAGLTIPLLYHPFDVLRGPVARHRLARDAPPSYAAGIPSPAALKTEHVPMTFHDITVNATGDIRSRRTHDSTRIEPAAVEVFRHLMGRHGEDFRMWLPVRGLEHLELGFTRAGTAARATFWSRRAPVTTSALVPGLDADDDRQALEGLQALVVRFFGGSSAKPGFDLLAIPERPLLAMVPLPLPPQPHPDMGIIAHAETCLAAAFFLAVIEG